MKRLLTTIFAVCLCFSGFAEDKENNNKPVNQVQVELPQMSGHQQIVSGPRAQVKPLPEGDVLKQVLEINKKGSPTTTYRKGHVSNHTLSEKAVAVTGAGFTVDLPGNFPIPTPVVYKGKIYVSGGFGSKQFYCVDAKTGKPVWAMNLDDDGPTSAVIEDNVVVFNTESCTLFALDATTGKHLWSWWLGDPLASTPAISQGKVYTTYPANAQGRAVHSSHILGCFDLKTGKILWQKWIDGDGMTAPVIEGNTLYLTTFPGTLYKVDATSGKIMAANNTRATCAPTIVGKDVYFSRRSDKDNKVRESISVMDDGFVKEKKRYNGKDAAYLDESVQIRAEMASKSASLDAGNGFSIAPSASGYQYAAANVGQGRVSSMQAFQGSRILHHEGFNYNCMGDELLCTDPKNGKVSWQIKLKGDLKKVGGFLGTPPAMAGSNLVVGTLDGRVLVISPDKGTITKEYKVGSPIRFQPTIVDGRIYVGTQNGKLVCIDTKDTTLTGWPMWGKNAAHTGR